MRNPLSAKTQPPMLIPALPYLTTYCILAEWLNSSLFKTLCITKFIGNSVVLLICANDDRDFLNK